MAGFGFIKIVCLKFLFLLFYRKKILTTSPIPFIIRLLSEICLLTPVKTRFCAASCECRYEHPDHIKKSHFSKNFIEKWDFFISVKPYNAKPFSIVITQKIIGKMEGFPYIHNLNLTSERF